jgi:hypothetical protein
MRLTHDYTAFANRTARSINLIRSVRARKNWAYDRKQAKPGVCVVLKRGK